ncbi:hypothetical protein GGTG_07278 [Gaeumannomyces tritici R3-111a-1]|uniref:C6 zinc finger domain-containing protein n=1 Tax=Gaeumannomyces tritici (strain R3-111a-1) TaxID=644352 RepID=J3P181_GAET3|nr:hypothetical protein GGTG_07278 [Gaeumannomyces tritici R3-111a-1]EJT77366.1 hypothetical protein GGTG_07278 [Gaeumannomyces tritici R3-111a-1]
MAPAATASRPRPAAGLQFVMDPAATGKASPDTRKLIRRHVMLGKNTGKTRPPRNPALPSPTKRNRPSRSSRSDGSDGSDGSEDSAVAQRHARGADTRGAVEWAVPPPFGHVLAALALPPDVQRHSVVLFLQFYQQISIHMVHPLHMCLSFEETSQTYILPIVADQAYLHSVISGACRAWQGVLPQGSSKRAEMNRLSTFHASRALTALRRRLDEDDERSKLSISTIMCAMMLAWYCFTTGDVASARVHTEGIGRLVLLRGGVGSFWPSPRPLLEIMRCDLAVAISSGLPPVIPKSSPGGEQVYLEYPDLSRFLQKRALASATASISVPAPPTWPPTQGHMDLSIDDPELGRVWRELSDFCAVANFAAASSGGQNRMTSQTYMCCMAASMYRLTAMRFAPGSGDEAVRLGLLAFAEPVFLPWGCLGVKYGHLADALRRELARPELAWALSPGTIVWLLMIAGVSMLDFERESWLRSVLWQNLGLCGVESWAETRDLLMNYLWVGAVHDRGGEAMYHAKH